jgi:hypothetical protein
MRQLNGNQKRRLRKAIESVYEGLHAESSFAMLLRESLDVGLEDLAPSSETFPEKIHTTLVKLTAKQTLELLDALQREYPEAVEFVAEIESIRAEAAPFLESIQGANQLQKLESSYLLVDGFPFVNRTRLRVILAELFRPGTAARVGIVTGAAFAGKSWSLHLIRAYRKAMQDPKARLVIVDLERLQPGNDPLVCWKYLMKSLCDPKPPPDPPPLDTMGGQYGQRLVAEVTRAWDAWEPGDGGEKPWLLIVFDHLEKNSRVAVGKAVVDFADLLAVAALKHDLEGGRVLLLGFPRGFSPVLTKAALALRENVSPLTSSELKAYIAEVEGLIGRGAPAEIEEALLSALEQAYQKPTEERRIALLELSGFISRQVNAFAMASA